MATINRSIKMTLLLASSVCLAACGKRGPLVYPDLVVPKAPNSVEARAVGDGVKLSFMLPSAGQQDNDSKSITEVQMYRQDISATEQFCSACKDSIPFHKTVYLETLRGAERHGNLMLLMDSDVQSERHYRYRFALKTRGGVTGTQSLPVTVFAARPFAAPLLSVESTPTEAILRITGERPPEGVFAGYTVYRRTKESQSSLMPLLQTLLKENSYTDFTLKPGVKYLYGVRSAYKNDQGDISESLLSNEVEAERSMDD